MKVMFFNVFGIRKGIQQAICGIGIRVFRGFPAEFLEFRLDLLFIVIKKCQRMDVNRESIS